MAFRHAGNDMAIDILRRILWQGRGRGSVVLLGYPYPLLTWLTGVQSGQQQWQQRGVGSAALVDVEMPCHWHSERKRKHSPRFPQIQKGCRGYGVKLRNSIRQMSGCNVCGSVRVCMGDKSAGQVKGKSQRHLTLHMLGWGRLICLKFWLGQQLSWCCWSHAKDESDDGLKSEEKNFSIYRQWCLEDLYGMVLKVPEVCFFSVLECCKVELFFYRFPLLTSPCC